jgi:hypothetical protein
MAFTTLGNSIRTPVPGGLDDAAMVLNDLRFDQLAAVGLETGERAFLIRAHQARVPGDIGG